MPSQTFPLNTQHYSRNISLSEGNSSGPILPLGAERLAGLKTARHFGEIAYTLIDYEWMSAQPTDTIDDFNDVFDFATAFDDLVAF